MKTFEFLPRRVPVLSPDTRQFSCWMKSTDALQALKLGRAEELYNSAGEFQGIVLRESPVTTSQERYRSSLEGSNSSLTESDSLANAGIAKAARVFKAREKVGAWPVEYDHNAVVISAGRVRGATLVPSLACL